MYDSRLPYLIEIVNSNPEYRKKLHDYLVELKKHELFNDFMLLLKDYQNLHKETALEKESGDHEKGVVTGIGLAINFIDLKIEELKTSIKADEQSREQ